MIKLYYGKKSKYDLIFLYISDMNGKYTFLHLNTIAFLIIFMTKHDLNSESRLMLSLLNVISRLLWTNFNHPFAILITKYHHSVIVIG